MAFLQPLWMLATSISDPILNTAEKETIQVDGKSNAYLQIGKERNAFKDSIQLRP